jgi:hypothetical protein
VKVCLTPINTETLKVKSATYLSIMMKMDSILSMVTGVNVAENHVWNVLYLSADGVVKSYIREGNKMAKFQRKILVTLLIDADNAKCADSETKDVAGIIRTIETNSYSAIGGADATIKSAEIIPNYRRQIIR